jgi:hypothetical protein
MLDSCHLRLHQNVDTNFAERIMFHLDQKQNVVYVHANRICESELWVPIAGRYGGICVTTHGYMTTQHKCCLCFNFE